MACFDVDLVHDPCATPSRSAGQSSDSAPRQAREHNDHVSLRATSRHEIQTGAGVFANSRNQLMIRALELENFKAFGERTRIEFAPITLIYGQNSAGKSSILNALNLLKQTRMSREQGALLLPRAESGLVDLGSFHELLHDHDPGKTLVIRVDVYGGNPRRRFARELDEDLGPLGFEVGFHREHDQKDVALAYVQAYAGTGTQPVLRFEPATLTESEARNFRRFYSYWRSDRWAIPGELKAVACVGVTDAPEFWKPYYEQAVSFAEETVRGLKAMREEISTKGQKQMSLFQSGDVHKEDIDSAIEFYSRSFTLDEFITRRRQAELGSTALLDGFILLPSRGEQLPKYPELHAWRFMRDGPGTARWRMFDAGEFVFHAGRLLDRELDRLFPLGPYRRAPERLYIFAGTTPMDVGYSGNLLPDLLFRRPELVAQANAWLDRLDVGYHIKIDPVGTSSNDLFEVRLLDTRRSKQASVALPDVGFGISQILPFIVQTLASEEQTITIEQPEVHVHPKLQADLADLLIAGIQSDRNHRYMVETHSEHLILRLLRRIRETTEGTLPEGIPGLRADQVSVVYLQRGSEGATVNHLRIDPSGEFIDPWPQGFFDERFAEIYGS
ncbi:MAG: DUF3696 domain-containing protein [Enhygromyxa sp.]